jgi:3-methyladenine DNA glycosylase AlkC
MPKDKGSMRSRRKEGVIPLAAVEQLKAIPEVEADAPIGPALMFKTIVPLGKEIGAQVAVRADAASIVNQLAADEKAVIRALACVVLGEVGQATPKRIIDVAHRLAADGRWEVREAIANAFDDQVWQTQPEFVYELMAQWVHDPDANVRRVPTNALMRYGIRQPLKVIALMKDLLHDDSEYVRKNVAFCLQQIAKVKHPILGAGHADNPDVMLAALHEWSDDTDWRARWIIARTLGNVWAKDRIAEALKLLKKLGTDGNKRVQTAVVSSLQELARKNPEVVKQTMIKWGRDKNANVRAVAEKAQAKLATRR